MKPGISIVICTYNGVRRLGPVIEYVINQKVDEEVHWELIIVDNASTDQTSAFCRKLLQPTSLDWKVAYEVRSGLSHARIRGLRESRYEFVLFCDDDNYLYQDYIQTGYEILSANPSIGALGGCGIPLFEHSRPDWFERHSHSFAVGPQAPRNGKVPGLPAELYGAGTFFYKRPLLRCLDLGFQPVMSDRTKKQLVSGGDVEMCYILQLAGYEIWYSGALKFCHWMPARRMKWKYYMQLKEAIAMGTGKILPYQIFFKDAQPTDLAFWKTFAGSAVKHSAVCLAFLLRKRLTPEKYTREQRSLGSAILPAKALSTWKYMFKAYRHFRNIRNIA